jgi:hypothetical protein
LTDEFNTESTEDEEADDEPCKEDEAEEARPMNEAMIETRLSDQDISGMKDINVFIYKMMWTQTN